MLGSRGDEASALNGLGETACTAGDPGSAAEKHSTALALADEALNLPERARATTGWLAHTEISAMSVEHVNTPVSR
ncbi:hypothetical protein [Nocardia pseudovaccinii]|uniref:hypothetical protein n=1 Tax=Nocardia pseudovaccinii TaxID=189540 RepID=UPI0007A54171|nr:hypothetical protein [Nocardia pseudovaccinii]